MTNSAKNQRISVIVPLYGSFSVERAIISVKSILSQCIPDLEVIIFEQGGEKRFPNIQGVNHIFRYYKPKSRLSDFNPGKIRNQGIVHSTGEFVYTTDADIVFSSRDYLSRAKEFFETNSGKVLFRPKMRRLPVDNFATFNELVGDYGIVKAISKLDFEQKYLVTVDHLPRKVRVFEKESTYKKTFTAFEDDFQRFIEKENEGNEPLFWNENRHCGGNLFRRIQFVSIGGYCENFLNWGCEDSDLQWKFAEKYGLVFFPDDLEVIHLDHHKEYFSPEMWARNEKIHALRKKEGIEIIIKKDRMQKRWNL